MGLILPASAIAAALSGEPAPKLFKPAAPAIVRVGSLNEVDLAMFAMAKFGALNSRRATAATANAWDPARLDADGALSISNTVATFTGQGCVQSKTSITNAQKKYFEVVITSVGGSAAFDINGIGIGTASADITIRGAGQGSADATNYGYQVSTSPGWYNGGSRYLTGSDTPAEGVNIGIAYDGVNGWVYFRINGTWQPGNGGLTGTPTSGATGTGNCNPSSAGTPFALTGTWYAMAGTRDGSGSHPIFTLKNTAALVTYSVPSGYTTLD